MDLDSWMSIMWVTLNYYSFQILSIINLKYQFASFSHSEAFLSIDLIAPRLAELFILAHKLILKISCRNCSHQSNS